MEHIFIAEAELQKGLSRMNLDLGSEKDELEVFEPLSGSLIKLDVARDELKKADNSASDYERRV